MAVGNFVYAGSIKMKSVINLAIQEVMYMARGDIPYAGSIIMNRSSLVGLL